MTRHAAESPAGRCACEAESPPTDPTRPRGGGAVHALFGSGKPHALLGRHHLLLHGGRGCPVPVRGRVRARLWLSESAARVGNLQGWPAHRPPPPRAGLLLAVLRCLLIKRKV